MSRGLGDVYKRQLVLSAAAVAQVPVDESGKPLAAYPQEPFDDSAYSDEDTVDLDAVELEELVGPIALHPDDLLAIILPASTYPLEIVQAARFLEALEGDSTLEPDEDWDDAVVALLNYPEVVRMLDENIDWTWRLGEAVLAQQAALIAAVESFRDRAYAAGNLKTDERQEVSYENGSIEIVPVDDEIIYVPYYEPTEVVVSQPRRVYHYYPEPYPVYYYPYPSSYRFRTGFFWGVTTAYTIGWPNHYLHVHHPSYWGHPYYGRYYYGHYYRRPSINVYNTWYVDNGARSSRYRYRDGDRWQHRRRSRTTVVNNYHYDANGSRNSRDYTVTRRDRFRGSDTTRTVNRRNDATTATRSNGSARSRTSADRERNTIEFRDRRASPATVSTNRRNETGRTTRTSPSRSNDQTTRDAIRFRDRGTATSGRTSSRQSATTSPTRTRRQETTASVQRREQRQVAAAGQLSSGRATSSRRATSASNRQSTAPAANVRRPAAAASRPASSTNRQRPSVTPSRSSAPRSSAPRQPRASAPSAGRTAAPPRANSRSSTGSASGSASERRASSRRVRPNND